MKPKRPMQETLRYQNYVANLRHKQPYHKEAALLKEIAGGVQWRMDAAVEALCAEPAKGGMHARGYVNRHNIMKQAAMFGRLQTTEKLAKAFNFGEEGSRHADGPVIAAFHVAVLHGHYKVADFLHEKCGAHPDYDSGDRTPPAMSWAINEGNLKKISYLLDKGASASHALTGAISNAKHSKAVIDLLLNKGADVNAAAEGFWTPFLMAVKYRRFDLAEHLLSKGADPSKSGGEVMLNIIEAKNNKLLERVIELGAKPDADLVQRALYAGNMDAADIMMKTGHVNINAHGGAILLTALRAKEQPEAVMCCLKHGADPAIALRSVMAPKQSWEKRADDAEIAKQLTALVENQTAAPKTNTPKPDAPKPPRP